MAIIKQSGMETLIALLRKENPGIPVAINSSNTRLVDVQLVGGGKYQATLMGRYGTGWQGRVNFKYKRLDLAKLFNPALDVGILGATTLYELLPDLERTYGIVLTQDDVIDQPLSGPLPQRITMRAKLNSVLYHGSVDLNIIERQTYLDEIIERGDYDHSLTDVQMGMGVVELVSYSNDYTGIASLLNFKPDPYVTGGTVANDARLARLITGLSGIDSAPWVAEGTAYALAGASVVYNGLTADLPVEVDSGKEMYDRVLVLALLSGRKVYFYYNWWIDPAIAAQFPGPWEL